MILSYGCNPTARSVPQWMGPVVPIPALVILHAVPLPVAVLSAVRAGARHPLPGTGTEG